jgi:hypothetical protein
LIEIARRENNSVLRDRSFDGLASTSFADIEKEIKTHCPLFYQFWSTMIGHEHDNEKKTSSICLNLFHHHVQELS